MEYCWMGKREWIESEYGYMSDEYVNYVGRDDGPNETCTLEDGHEGPHEWTPNDQIFLTFSGKHDE